jgi:DNA-binding XRE family transcriptional regulator
MAHRRSGSRLARLRVPSPGKATELGSVDVLVGHRVRVLRLQHRLSQQALAAAIGASLEDIRQFEAGAKRIGAARVLAIARVFETDVGVLFGSSGAPPVKPTGGGGRARPASSRLIH